MMPLCSTLYKLLALRCSESCWSLRKGLLQRVLTSRMRSVYRHITWLLTTRRLVTLAEVRNHLSRFLHDVFNNGLAELYTSRCTSWSTCSAMHTKLFHFSVTRCTHHIGGVVSYTHMDIFFAFFCIFPVLRGLVRLENRKLVGMVFLPVPSPPMWPSFAEQWNSTLS